MRPASIVTFDRLYLVAIGLGLVPSLLSIDNTRALIAANPAARALNAVDSMVYASIGLSIVIPLALWFLIAHRASVVAKWILVGFTALVLINMALNQREAGAVAGLGILLTLAIEAMRVVAITFLFRTDAKAWFGTAASEANAAE